MYVWQILAGLFIKYKSAVAVERAVFYARKITQRRYHSDYFECGAGSIATHSHPVHHCAGGELLLSVQVILHIFGIKRGLADRGKYFACLVIHQHHRAPVIVHQAVGVLAKLGIHSKQHAGAYLLLGAYELLKLVGQAAVKAQKILCKHGFRAECLAVCVSYHVAHRTPQGLYVHVLAFAVAVCIGEPYAVSVQQHAGGDGSLSVCYSCIIGA